MLNARIVCRFCVKMFAETRSALAMSMYARLLGFAAVVFGFGLSEALAAGDVWKGSWKYELGHPELDVDKWGALENRFFDLLDSGRPLTISAEGKSYVLPPVNAPRWWARWQKIC